MANTPNIMMCYTSTTQRYEFDGSGDTHADATTPSLMQVQAASHHHDDVLSESGLMLMGTDLNCGPFKFKPSSSSSFHHDDASSMTLLPVIPDISGSASSLLGAEVVDARPKPNRRPSPKNKRQLPGKTATNKERHYVQHNYRDLANEPVCSGSRPVLAEKSFPMQLHRVLDELEDLGYTHIISWQPHGRAFIIRDRSLFQRDIMPKYFPNSTKITSIQRQFNLYGFETLSREGPDKGAYYHEAFLRGRPDITSCFMVRKRVKGTGHKACSNPDAEPDLYAMPYVARGGGKVSGSSSSYDDETRSNNTSTSDEMRSLVTTEESISSQGQGHYGYVQEATFYRGEEESHSHSVSRSRQDNHDFIGGPIDVQNFDWYDTPIIRGENTTQGQWYS